MENFYTINNLWMLVCTMMIFVMHLGFAALEAGFTQSKNTINILFKNLLVPVVGIMSFTYVGYNLMYPGEEFSGQWFGYSGWGHEGVNEEHIYDRKFPFWALISFKAMFAATAATIVSGSVAERIHFRSFMIFSILFVTFCYPVVGMWLWGGGYLSTMETPFYDFSGASIVHSVGGWGALAGTIMLGPRICKFENGKSNQIEGHSMALATTGIFLLWFGWFGFNAGSVFSAEPLDVSLVVLNTAIGGSAGAAGSWLFTWIFIKTHYLPAFISGILGALVSTTAGANLFLPHEAGITGFVSGFLVVFTIQFFNKVKIDDPVSAIPSHLVCGIWGTLAVGLMGDLAGWNQFLSQLFAILVIGAFSFTFSMVFFYLLKVTIGLRVSEKVEIEGLDIEEHGMKAYR
ncbi:ammonium transporter [Cytophagaceae bacterium ABcell3]|nr:ammonium transporter [Cytophagaceae bacterium ABcell3]